MNLPTSLLSEFAKVTNDEAEKPKEYTAYGKVISVNTQTGTYNVLLDGAENPIVCDATTTAKQNDRVTVTIKNRQATVTGNATSKTINGDVLVDGNGTFKGRVEAESGYFKGELQAATGTFSGNLSAAGGTFKGNLSAAGGTFSGTLSVKNSTVSSKVVIGQSGQAAIMLTDQSSTWYNNAYIMMNTGYVTASLGPNTYTTLSHSGVESSNGARLISSSEISTLSNLAGWINRGKFTGNLNSTTIAPGFYHVGSSDSYSGTKPSPAPTWCLFFQSPAYNTQIFIDASDKFIAFRDYTGSPAAWGAWRKITAS